MFIEFLLTSCYILVDVSSGRCTEVSKEDGFYIVESKNYLCLKPPVLLIENNFTDISELVETPTHFSDIDWEDFERELKMIM